MTSTFTIKLDVINPITNQMKAITVHTEKVCGTSREHLDTEYCKQLIKDYRDVNDNGSFSGQITTIENI